MYFRGIQTTLANDTATGLARLILEIHQNQVLSLVLSIFNPSNAEYGRLALTVMGGIPGREIGVVIDIACVGNEGTV